MNNIVSVAHKNGLHRHETSIVKPMPVYNQYELIFEEEINLIGTNANQKKYTKEVIYGHYSNLDFYISYNDGEFNLPSNMSFGLDYVKASINSRREIQGDIFNAFNKLISEFDTMGTERMLRTYSMFFRNGNIYMPYFRPTADITTDLILYLKVFGYNT